MFYRLGAESEQCAHAIAIAMLNTEDDIALVCLAGCTPWGRALSGKSSLQDPKAKTKAILAHAEQHEALF